MTTKHTHRSGDEQKFWDECFLIAFDECLKQLGQRKAPACVDDSAELATLALAARSSAQGK